MLTSQRRRGWDMYKIRPAHSRIRTFNTANTEVLLELSPSQSHQTPILTIYVTNIHLFRTASLSSKCRKWIPHYNSVKMSCFPHPRQNTSPSRLHNFTVSYWVVCINHKLQYFVHLLHPSYLLTLYTGICVQKMYVNLQENRGRCNDWRLSGEVYERRIKEQGDKTRICRAYVKKQGCKNL